jgi:hypothetical protein
MTRGCRDAFARQLGTLTARVGHRRPAAPARAALVSLAGILGFAVGVGLTLGGCGGGGPSPGDELAERQAEVADRGAEVMPFALDATTHRFTPTADGLVQTVIADDPGDREQAALVRQHLADEAERFRRGDYGDPAAIHGDDMPGLAELEADPTAITIELTAVPAGAELTFATDDDALVGALHRWGEPQISDHGAHAASPDS